MTDDFEPTVNNGYALPASLLDTNACSTPRQLTHKIYGGIAYTTKTWQTPLMLGAGGHYEFASNNSAIEGWGMTVKAGLSF